MGFVSYIHEALRYDKNYIVSPMLVRQWVDTVDDGPKLNQHWVNVSRGSAVRHCVLALVILLCGLVFDDCSCKYKD